MGAALRASCRGALVGAIQRGARVCAFLVFGRNNDAKEMEMEKL